MVDSRTGATSTVTTGAGSSSACCRHAVDATTTAAIAAKDRMLDRFISKTPRQRLQLRQCDPVTSARIVKGVARLDQRVLSVDDFERRRFTGAVAQPRETKAFSSEVRQRSSAVQRG